MRHFRVQSEKSQDSERSREVRYPNRSCNPIPHRSSPRSCRPRQALDAKIPLRSQRVKSREQKERKKGGEKRGDTDKEQVP